VRYAGVDEVGYGALAGPMVAVAVAVDADVDARDLKRWWPLQGVKDSKKTTFAQREELHPRLVDFLLRAGASVGLGDVPPSTIDRYGYGPALEWAKVEAVRQCVAEEEIDLLVVDGSIGLPPAKIFHTQQRVAPKADNDYWVVAAASILAKVYRDRIMLELDKSFPEYDFVHNMGYTGGGKATSVHVDALRRLGLTKHHRRVACRTVLS